MRDNLILSAMIGERKFYDSHFDQYETQDTLPSIIRQHIDEYYQQDKEATAVDRELLQQKIEVNGYVNEDIITEYLKELPFKVSIPNLEKVIREQALKEQGLKIAQLIHAEKFDEASEHMSAFINFNVDEVQVDEAVYCGVSLEDIQKKFQTDNLLPIYPPTLNEKLGGGVARQSQIGIIARPDVGKTTIAVNIAAGMCASGHKVVYFCNEDPDTKMIMRFLCRFTGMSPEEMDQCGDKVMEIAEKNGYNNLVLVSMSPGNIKEIKRHVNAFTPDAIIVDQIRNITVPGVQSTAMTDILNYGPQATRAIAKEHNLVSILITQAGESASDKLVLDYSDVEYSNTGFAGQLDLLIGVGQNRTFKEDSRVMLSFSKNKICEPLRPFDVKMNYVTNKVTV